MAFNNFNNYLIRLTCSNVQYSAGRLYSRWQSRRPSRAFLQTLPTSGSSLTEESIIDLDPKVLQDSLDAQAEKSKASKSKKKTIKHAAITESNEEKKLKQVVSIDKQKIRQRREEALDTTNKLLSMQRVFDDNGEIIYKKLKDNDGRVSTLLTMLKSRKDRARVGQVMVEGWRLVVDGLEANCSLNYLIFSRITDLNNIKKYLPEKGVKIYKIPYKEISMWSDVDTSPGILGVFQTPTPKNVRRQRDPLPLQIICDNIRTPGNLGAILRAAVGVGCDKVLLMKGCVDMWDPKVIRSGAGAHFRLPIHGSLEWHQIPELVPEDTSVFIADNNAKVQMTGSHSSDDPELIKEDIADLNVPVLPYYGVDYGTLQSITLVIGGETEGISEESYRFAASRNGVRVNIPLQNGVDSLNTGMATAVIAFEIKKQILEAKTKDNLYSAAQ